MKERCFYGGLLVSLRETAVSPVIRLHRGAVMLRLMLLRPLPKLRGRVPRQLSRLVIWWTEDFPVSVFQSRFRFSVPALVQPPDGAQLPGKQSALRLLSFFFFLFFFFFFMRAPLPSVWELGLRWSGSEGPGLVVKGLLLLPPVAL